MQIGRGKPRDLAESATCTRLISVAWFAAAAAASSFEDNLDRDDFVMGRRITRLL